MSAPLVLITGASGGIGHKVFAKGRREVVPGLSNKMMAVLPRISPTGMTMRLIKKLQTQN